MSHSSHALMLALAVSLAVSIDLHAESREPPHARVIRVRIVTTGGLSADAIGSLRNEAANIWQREDVQLVWTGDEPADIDVDIVVGELRPYERAGQRVALGAITFGQTGGRAAGVRLFARTAARMLDRLVPSRIPARGREHLLARALGRALAHEVGHYLLGRSHTETGLLAERNLDFWFIEQGGQRFAMTPAQRSFLQRRQW